MLTVFISLVLAVAIVAVTRVIGVSLIQALRIAGELRGEIAVIDLCSAMADRLNDMGQANCRNPSRRAISARYRSNSGYFNAHCVNA